MMHDHPLVLVTGATGAVGPRVVEALSRAGFRIRVLSLDPMPARWQSMVEDAVTGDICDPGVVLTAMQGVDAVIHLAALLHIVDPPAALQERFRRINVGGTKTVVDAAVEANVRRLVFFSTIAVYGPSCGVVIDEDTTPRPDTFYAHTKLDAEKVVLSAKNGAGEPIGTVLRLAAVYGSRIKGNYLNLVKALQKGCFIPVGRGENRRTLIYDKDVAKAAVLALTHSAAPGRVYNVSDGCYHTMGAILEAICRALGRKSPRLSVPVVLVRYAVGMVEDAAHLVGRKSPVMRASIDKYVEDVAVDARRIREELGFEPTYRLDDGWLDAVREMRTSRKEGVSPE